MKPKYKRRQKLAEMIYMSGYNISSFGRLLGLGENTMKYIVWGKILVPRADTVQKIASGLKISYQDALNLVYEDDKFTDIVKEKYMKDMKKTKEWKPENNEIYYYCSHSGVIKDYFDDGNLTCLSRYMAKNCFKTREEAVQEYANIEEKLKGFYANS